MEHAKTITIVTQTEETNKGLVRAAQRPKPSNPIYALSNSRDMLQYKKNLCQVFGEEFLAQQKISPNGTNYQINPGSGLGNPQASEPLFLLTEKRFFGHTIRMRALGQ